MIFNFLLASCISITLIKAQCSTKKIQLADKNIKQILTHLNEFRNSADDQITSHSLPKLQEFVWNKQLEEQAYNCASQCVEEQNLCRNTPKNQYLMLATSIQESSQQFLEKEKSFEYEQEQEQEQQQQYENKYEYEQEYIDQIMKKMITDQNNRKQLLSPQVNEVGCIIQRGEKEIMDIFICVFNQIGENKIKCSRSEKYQNLCNWQQNSKIYVESIILTSNS